MMRTGGVRVGSFGSIGLNAVLISTFIASCVEMTEMVIIVVGVGAIRGWRSTLIGAAAGMAILIGIVFGLGQALALIPIDTVRIIIGALLLTFGLQWYRKGVIGVASEGFTGGEDEEVGAEAGDGGALDWTAFVLAFKGVLLEGLEIAFIVVAFGAGGGTGSGGTTSSSYTSAYVGALAAFVLIGVAGFAARSRLESVPGQTLKFGVGGLLSTFGTYWMLEGLGVSWPTGKYSLAWLYAAYLASTFAALWAVRAGLLGPRPTSGEPAPGPQDPSGLAPASASSIREFQRRHDLAPDGVVGPRTQAAILAVRRELGKAAPDPGVLGVDPANEQMIRALQERVGIPVTGVIEALTRGALRVLQHPGMVDPTDADGVRAFQRNHDLAVNGRLDEPTAAALQALRTHDQKTPDPASTDPVCTASGLDVTDQASVCRFQRSIGLRADGALTQETAGALRTLRALHLWDGSFDGWGIEPYPLEPRSVRAFQERHRLEASGVIDETTRQAMRWSHDVHLGVDAVDAESVRAFQQDHDLRPDGIVGGRTQAALRAARAERMSSLDDDEAQRRYGAPDVRGVGRLVDPADSEQVGAFQRSHGIPESGIVDEATRGALAAVRRDFPDSPHTAPIGTGSEEHASVASTLWGWLTSFGRFWYGFIIGDDWVAAAGVGVALGGTYGIIQLGIVAWWFGPAAILATAAYTIRRELFRRTRTAC